MKGCCDMMRMVLGRARPNDRIGLMVETLFSLRTGRCRETIGIRFHRAPRGDKAQFSSATFAELNYCPWCGEQSRKPAKNVAKGRKR